MSWLGYDIPSDETLEEMGLSTKLLTRLKSYNTFPKGILSNIPKRIETLESVSGLGSDVSNLDHALLNHSLEIAAYLRHTFIRTNSPKLQNNPLLLNAINEIKTIKTRTGEVLKIGCYELELIDYFHRPLAPYYDEYARTAIDNKLYIKEFFLWLDCHQPSKKMDHIYYYTDEEKLKVTTTIHNSLLCDQQASPLTYIDKHKFIIDENNHLLILPINDDAFRHSSLSRYEPVFFAGHIKVLDGLITYMDNNSGHYMPDKQRVELTYNKLLSQGLSFHPDLEIKIIGLD